MKKHADILRPKFDTVLSVLESELGGLEIGSWMAPRGGYFISFDALDGCAKAIVAKAKEAGCKVDCTVYDGMFHEFQMANPFLPEAKKAWQEVKEFIERIKE